MKVSLYKPTIRRHSSNTMFAQKLPAGLPRDIRERMAISADKDFRTILLEELEVRCNRNSRYSLRAFARFLGLTPSRLSEIMNRRSGLSRELAEKMAKRLDFNKQEIEIFCDLVESEHARSPAKRQFAKLKLQKYVTPEYGQLQLDAFKAISDWYCFPILELTKLKTFKNNENWIAKALDITPTEAKAAIERLQRLNLLELKDGKLVPTENFTATPNDIPSDAIKKAHQQLLEKAIASLFLQPIEKRDYSAVVMGIEPRRLPEAKALIKDFRRNFTRLLSESESNKDVYCLSMQFFNLTPALEEMT